MGIQGEYWLGTGETAKNPELVGVPGEEILQQGLVILGLLQQLFQQASR